MKKIRIYSLAVAVMTAMCLIACNDKNDGKDNNEESAIATPKYAEQACKFILNDPVLMSDGRKLSSIELTESGRIYVELKDDNGKVAYYSDSYKYNNGVYTCAGKHIKGTVTEVTTLASERTSIKRNISIILGSGSTLSMETTVDVALSVMKVISVKSGDSDIISTWRPRAIVIDIDGAFKEFPGGDLDNVRKEAEAQGVELNDEDRKVLKKVVEYVTVSTNMLAIDYTDGTSDVADWNWINSVYDNISLKLKDAGMGNKFIVDDPSVNVEFSKPQGYMNLTISATITDSKKHEAALTLRLEQVPEAK